MSKLFGPLLALLILAVLAPATATTAAGRSGVPWDQVGDGWVLATVIRGRVEQGAELSVRARSLELISPDGVRHPLHRTTRQAPKNNVDPGNFTLIGWDPSARTALLKRYVSLARKQAIHLDLETGATRTLALPKAEMATGLRPDGSGVLTQTLGGRILSIAWDGTRTTLGRAGQGGAITTPDGTSAVVAEGRALLVLPLDGASPHRVATPGQCRPLRWYSDTALLASCYSRKGSRLVTVGLDGAVTAMARIRRTSRPGFRGPSWEDTDVRQVGGTSYYEGNGPCGGSFITRENAKGQVRTVRVPGSRGGVSLVDGLEDRLLIAHTETCDGGLPRAVLSTFDPRSLDEDVLVRLAKNEHWGHVLAWDEPRPWGY